MRPAPTLILTAAVALGALGCSHRATITRADGETVDGVIVGSDAEQVYVDVDARTAHIDTRRPGVIRIPRDRIREIDHPGAGHTVSGVAVFVGGLLALAAGGFYVGVAQGHYEPRGVEPPVFALPMLLGSGLLAAGAWSIAVGDDVEGRSRRAAHRPRDRRPRVWPTREPISVQVTMKMVPIDLYGQKGFGGGIGLGVPLAGDMRVEPAVEVDTYPAHDVAMLRAPLRLGFSMPMPGGDSRLDVMPEVGPAMGIPLGDDPSAEPAFGLSMGLMFGHRFPTEQGVEIELAHGVSLTRLGASGEYKDMWSGDFVLRLGARFAP